MYILHSEWVWRIIHAAPGVPVLEQECSDHTGGTPQPHHKAFPAQKEAQERHPQGRAVTEM